MLDLGQEKLMVVHLINFNITFAVLLDSKKTESIDLPLFQGIHNDFENQNQRMQIY